MTGPARHILLGITGGVAAYKACQLLRLMQTAGWSVQVVMTEAATKFVTPMTFQALSGRPVYTDAWAPVVANHMPHIELAREADLVVVAPATADFMAKLASGQTPDLLSSLCLARDIPLLIAPAMNRQMWQHPATQDSVERLAAHGVHQVGPDAGHQACGEVGTGRMAEPQAILAAAQAILTDAPPRAEGLPLRGLLAGRRVLLTAGPTAEPIDPVRVISNRSSGQMGYALAAAAAEAGAEVVMVSGPTALPCPTGVVRVSIQTALEMAAAVDEVLNDWRTPQDTAFMGVAAVADWRLAEPLTHKMKKSTSGPAFGDLQWVENPDILAGVAQRAAHERPAVVLGFAAESGAQDDLLAELPRKRARKQADILIGNLAEEALGASHVRLWLCDAQGVDALSDGQALPKAEQAAAIVRHLAASFGQPT